MGSEPLDASWPPLARRVSAQVPIVVVGASYRDASTEVRARLVAMEQSSDPPSEALVKSGWAEAVTVVETCSRVEWVISSTRGEFAADLLQSALFSRAGEVRLHRRAGAAAVHYLMRVAMGLDSVAEGELAVGRQVARAFELSHVEGRTDVSTRVMWRALQQLLAERRKRGVVQHGVGVQSLAVDALVKAGVARGRVLVFGLGEIGRATLQTLRDRGFDAEGYRRATHETFLAQAETADAVMVCSGAPSRFLDLPARDGGVVVDVGSPQQTRSAPGWQLVSLEDLLSAPRAQLDEAQREWLVSTVKAHADRASQDLSAPPPKGALGAVDDLRRTFLRETLPPLLADLPPAAAEKVRRAVSEFAHGVMQRVRAEGRTEGTGDRLTDAADVKPDVPEGGEP